MLPRFTRRFERRLWARFVGAAACSGALIYFSTADAIVPAVAWIAPVPVLILAFRRSDVRLQAEWRTALALAAFLAAALGQLRWLVLYRGSLPVYLLLPFPFVLGAAFALAVWLTSWAVERRGAWTGLLLFPLLWVSFEFALARWSPHGTAGSLAYSQVDFIPLIQVAAWTGLAGVTFIVQFVAAGFACGLAAQSRRRWAFVAVPALALVAVVMAGAWRVQASAEDVRALVGLISIDKAMSRFDTTAREEALPVVRSYLDAAAMLQRRDVEAIVMPEKLVGVGPGYEDEVSRLIAGASGDGQLLIVAGLNLVGRNQPRNVAAVFSRGRRVLEYDKRRLVPGLEAGYAVGDGPGLHKAPGGMTGVAICKDLDFAEIGRDYSRAGVGLLFAPAWDFTRDAELHARMAVMRGVEGGFSVARAAANGLLTGSDFLGRVVAERFSDEASASMLLANLPIGPGRTFYGEHGDWFAWSSLAAAAFMLAAATLRPRPRRGATTNAPAEDD